MVSTNTDKVETFRRSSLLGWRLVLADIKMAYPRGIEPLTSWSVAKRSIRLSYGYADVIEDGQHFIINERGMQLFGLSNLRRQPTRGRRENIGPRNLASYRCILFWDSAVPRLHDFSYGPAQP